MDQDEVNPYEKPTTKRTSGQPVNLLLVRWLQQCAETFPMYGKTLADYHGRFERFHEALKGLKDNEIDYAFDQALKRLTEFPVPAQILEFANELGRPEFRRMIAPAFKPDRPPIDLTAARQMFQEAVERLSAAKAMDAPGKPLHEQQREWALRRLGGSTIPVPVRPAQPGENPAVRAEALRANAEWAHDMAVKNGWIEQ